MSNVFIPRRELRSLHLLRDMRWMTSFLNNKASFGLFMGVDRLDQKDRRALFEEYPDEDIQVHRVMKRLSTMCFRGDDWKDIRTLIEGGHVNLYTNTRDGTKMMKETTIRKLISSPRHEFRFAYLNQQIVLKSKLLRWLDTPPAQRTIVPAVSLYMAAIHKHTVVSTSLLTRGNVLAVPPVSGDAAASPAAAAATTGQLQ
jgi:hypothetical protein